MLVKHIYLLQRALTTETSTVQLPLRIQPEKVPYQLKGYLK